MKQLAQGFNIAAHDANPGSRRRKSEAQPMSHCAPLFVYGSHIVNFILPLMWHYAVLKFYVAIPIYLF